MREEYTGTILRLIWKSIPDLSGSFTQFADCLKERASMPAYPATSGDPFEALADGNRCAILSILAVERDPSTKSPPNCRSGALRCPFI